LTYKQAIAQHKKEETSIEDTHITVEQSQKRIREEISADAAPAAAGRVPAIAFLIP
jgi:hypothetical protein